MKEGDSKYTVDGLLHSVLKTVMVTVVVSQKGAGIFDTVVETCTSLCLYFTSFTFHPTALLLSIHSELPISC